MKDIPVVILCGGKGTRLAEETSVRPKPMVDIGGSPILLHILRGYAHFDYRDFYLTLGYLGSYIKRYFIDYYSLSSDISVGLKDGSLEYLNAPKLDWRVNMYDTGNETLTGGRVKRMENILRPKGTFFLTYGDGVANVDIDGLLEFHRSHGKIATLTAVRPKARFGNLSLEGERITEFLEKPDLGEGWINGGYFAFEPEIFDYLTDDTTILERDPFERLARDGQLMAYHHHGFWQCMDTIRDRQVLEDLWAKDTVAPWAHYGAKA